jgi:hypothetical protein
MVTFLSELNGMELWATDIGNAYLEAYTAEKLYIVAGPEFGELKGHMLIISKALYGLRTSGLRWHKQFSQCLREMGFEPCKTEPDIGCIGLTIFINTLLSTYMTSASRVRTPRQLHIHLLNSMGSD